MSVANTNESEGNIQNDIDDIYDNLEKRIEKISG